MRHVFLAALSFTMAAPVAAAELPPAPVLDPEPGVLASGEGLYLRGDVGYAMPIDPSLSVNGVGHVGERLKKHATFGLGVGYDFVWLRADVTGDVFAERRLTAAAPGLGFSAKVNSVAVLANLYADLGTWSGITPYVGVGAGVAVNRLGAVRETVTATGEGLAYGGGTRTGFAWALMAGASIDITTSLKFDIGYRFSDLGKARAAGGAVRVGELRSHEVRFGLRYTFD